MLSPSECKIKAYLYAETNVCVRIFHLHGTANESFCISSVKALSFKMKPSNCEFFCCCVYVFEKYTHAYKVHIVLFFHPDTVRCFELILPNKKKKLKKRK